MWQRIELQGTLFFFLFYSNFILWKISNTVRLKEEKIGCLFWRCLFSSYGHLLTGLVFSVVFNFVSTLYILDTNSLSDGYSAKIFLPSYRLSFTLLIIPLLYKSFSLIDSIFSGLITSWAIVGVLFSKSSPMPISWNVFSNSFKVSGFINTYMYVLILQCER